MRIRIRMQVWRFSRWKENELRVFESAAGVQKGRLRDVRREVK